MNSREQDRLQKLYHKDIDTDGLTECKFSELPIGYQVRQLELSCISMINSILAYDCAGWQSAEDVLAYEETRPLVGRTNYLQRYVEALGRCNVVRLIEGQIISIDHIEKDVMTDSEGVTYNRIVWQEELPY